MDRSSSCPAVIVLMVSVLAACSTVPPAPPALQDTEWILADLPGHALLADVSVTLRLGDVYATGTDGCNRFLAPYEASNGALRIDVNGPSTLMACETVVEAQADRFRSALQKARGYAVEAGRLRLLDDDGSLLMTLDPQPVDLAETAWRVTGYNNGRGGVVTVLKDTTVTIVFGSDGNASGSAGCNSYLSRYVHDGDALDFGAVAATRKACGRPRGIMEQEERFLAALETVASVAREGNRLELRTAEGALALQLVPDTPVPE